MPAPAHPKPPAIPKLPDAVPRGHASAPWEAAYLEFLAESGQKVQAARQAGVGRLALFRHRQRVPGFALQEQEAIAASRDGFESEAVRRAIEGVAEERPGRNGDKLLHVEYSDSLLVKLLEKHDPAWNPKLGESKPKGTFETAAERRSALNAVRQAVDQNASLRIEIQPEART